MRSSVETGGNLVFILVFVWCLFKCKRVFVYGRKSSQYVRIRVLKSFVFIYKILTILFRKALRLQRPCVRIAPGVPKCVDERCNAENAARKCGVFTYNALLLERKGCKNSIFQNSSFAPREATFLRCALPNLWSGVVRTPRLKKE